MKKRILTVIILIALVQQTALARQILLVNRDRALPRNYTPVNLVKLSDYGIPSQDDASLDEEVAVALLEMYLAMQADGVTGFIVMSGYRTYIEQTELYRTGDPRYVCPPGKSEHQTGLAADLGSTNVDISQGKGFEGTPEDLWLKENAVKYGFIRRYPAGKETITKIAYEPWHYRFVGVEHSSTIMTENLVLEEYITSRPLYDVENSWVASYARELVEKGLISGYEDNSFRPENYITRAEFAVMIGRLPLEKRRDYEEFSDVKKNDWYYQAVVSAYEKGILSGGSDGFEPNRPMTRIEVVEALDIAFLVNFPANRLQPLPFFDQREIPRDMLMTVKKMVNLQLMGGYPDWTFRANEPINRGELAKILIKTLEAVEIL